ncbi:MAG TPA: G8 domain-containing protein [Candidatus Paceibacterota bacterium]|nr:G8 domain-containing protein [Candidatus Paceibacterota bacterium]
MKSVFRMLIAFLVIASAFALHPPRPDAATPGSAATHQTALRQLSGTGTGKLVPLYVVSTSTVSSLSPSNMQIDWIPDLYDTATKELVKSARWSDIAASLSASDVLRIPVGVTLTYDGTDPKPIKAIVVRGTLTFDPGMTTYMKVGTILVDGGSLFVEPNPGKFADILIHGSLDPKSDPAELLLGIVATSGTVHMTGRERLVPFSKVVASKGDTVLHLADAPDWRPGEDVVVTSSGPSSVDPTYWWFLYPDISRRMPFPEEWEEARVVSVKGKDVTIDRPLSYDHSGYAADLNRSVFIHSDPTNPEEARGHVMFAGKTSATIDYVRFYDMGRTTVASADDTAFGQNGTVVHAGKNERGRYALHAHHLSLPFEFKGDVVDGMEIDRSYPGSSVRERAIFGSPKWGIVNHDSYGDIADDVVVGAAGAGIVGEDGTETGTVEENLVIGTGGGSGQSDDDRFGNTKGVDMAHGGFGFWFRGPFLNVRNNIATGHFNQAGFVYFVHPDFVRNALSNASWIPADIRGKAHKDLVSREPIREFRNNTADGFFGTAAFMVFYSETPDTVSGLNLHIRGKGTTNGVFIRHSDAVTIADSTVVADGSSGQGIVSSPNPGTAISVRNAVSGFAK